LFSKVIFLSKFSVLLKFIVYLPASSELVVMLIRNDKKVNSLMPIG